MPSRRTDRQRAGGWMEEAHMMPAVLRQHHGEAALRRAGHPNTQTHTYDQQLDGGRHHARCGIAHTNPFVDRTDGATSSMLASSARLFRGALPRCTPRLRAPRPAALASASAKAMASSGEKISFGAASVPGYVWGTPGQPGVVLLQEWWGINDQARLSLSPWTVCCAAHC